MVKIALRAAFWVALISLVAPEQAIEALKGLGSGLGLICEGVWDVAIGDWVKKLF
jgi:hypothetical protein